VASTFRYYEGNGEPLGARGLKSPAYQNLLNYNEPSGYIADSGLRNAVNVALVLGQPLLVTGEPEHAKRNLRAASLTNLSWTRR